jgi:NitT/TauT family transport system substrate-binding protein
MFDVRKPAARFAAVLAAVLMAGSAVSAAAASAKSTSKLFPIHIGVSPTISSVDVWYAYSAGYFKRNGLNVRITVNTTSGAATFPLLLNGQLDMSVSDPVSPILAISQSVPLRLDALGNVISPTPSKDYAGLVVKSGSGITSAAQLAGKSVAVPSLDSILQLLAEATVTAAGGNASQVNFVETPPLSMVSAVASGQVTAFSNVEPLLTEAKAQGETVLAHPPAAMGGLPEDVIVSSKLWSSEHPKALAEFATALGEANAKLAKDPSLIKTTAAADNEVPSQYLSSMILPVFQAGTITPTMMTDLQKYMLKYGFIKKAITYKRILGQS